MQKFVFCAVPFLTAHPPFVILDGRQEAAKGSEGPNIAKQKKLCAWHRRPDACQKAYRTGMSFFIAERRVRL